MSGYLESPIGDYTLTIAFESAWYYGLNVTARLDTEAFPDTANVTTIDNVSCLYVVANVTHISNFTQSEYPNVRQWIRKTDDDFGWDWVNDTAVSFSRRAS